MVLVIVDRDALEYCRRTVIGPLFVCALTRDAIVPCVSTKTQDRGTRINDQWGIRLLSRTCNRFVTRALMIARASRSTASTKGRWCRYARIDAFSNGGSHSRDRLRLQPLTIDCDQRLNVVLQKQRAIDVGIGALFPLISPLLQNASTLDRLLST